MFCLHNFMCMGDGVQRVYPKAELELSKIWKCGHCGAKIYQNQSSKRPEYNCLCGCYEWVIYRRLGMARNK